MKTVLIVDATNLFIRGWTTNPSLDINGSNIGGIVSFLVSLRAYVDKCKPGNVIICWDGIGGSFKRKKIVKEYKVGRKRPKLNRNYDYELENVEQNKEEQKTKLIKYLDCLPVHQITIDYIEADDVIAYLTHHFKENRKVIVSSDKDFYQLLDEKTVMFLPIKKVFITSRECLSEYQIHPIQIMLRA